MKLLELYESIQGEGPRTGVPTTFVRFAGCNLRCPGWPCDTQHAIEPGIWRDFAVNQTPVKVSEGVSPLISNVCITGGEPLIQKAIEMEELVQELRADGHMIELFTNGTQPIPAYMHGNVNIMMDWKLTGSGEVLSEAQKTTRVTNVRDLHPTDGIKFVVKNKEDLAEAFQVWANLRDTVVAQFWVGAVWGEITDQDIIKFVLNNRPLPWRLNVQQHKHIWPADMQGV